MSRALQPISSKLLSGQSVQDYVMSARSHFDTDDIDSAIEDLTSAVEAFKNNQNLLAESVDTAIVHLSSSGQKADPPHPKALALIKLRMGLNTP